MRVNVIFFATVVLSMVAFGLLYFNSQINDQRRQLSLLDAELVSVHNDLSVLQSEWSFLTSPERLARLAEEHLVGYGTQTAEQVSYAYALPVRGSGSVVDGRQYASGDDIVGYRTAEYRGDLERPEGLNRLLHVGFSLFGMSDGVAGGDGGGSRGSSARLYNASFAGE